MLGRACRQGKEDERGLSLLTRWDKEAFGQLTATPDETPGGFQLVMLPSGTMVGKDEPDCRLQRRPGRGEPRGGGFRPGLDTLADERPGLAAAGEGICTEEGGRVSRGLHSRSEVGCGEHCARPQDMSWQRAKNTSAGTWHCRIGVRCDVPSRRSSGSCGKFETRPGSEAATVAKSKRRGQHGPWGVGWPDRGTSPLCRRAQCHSCQTRQNFFLKILQEHSDFESPSETELQVLDGSFYCLSRCRDIRLHRRVHPVLTGPPVSKLCDDRGQCHQPHCTRVQLIDLRSRRFRAPLQRQATNAPHRSPD